MYNVSDNYKTNIYNPIRTLRAKCSLDGINLTDDENIQSISITRPFISGNKLIGGAASSQISVSALDPFNKLLNVNDGAELLVSLGVEDTGGSIEWVPFQTITIDTIERDEDARLSTFSGFDLMTKLDAVIWNQIDVTYPATLREIADAVASSVGLSISSDAFLLEGQIYTEDHQPNFSGNETGRQIIGWIAEASLSNAIVTRNGNIKFISVVPSSTAISNIDSSNYYEFKPKSTYGSINTLILGRVPQEDNIYREDSAAVLSNGVKELRINNNPFIDDRRETVIDILFEAINGLNIIPYSLDWRGNPALDPGDIISIENNESKSEIVLLGDTSLEYNGGLRSEITLEISSLTETDKSTSISTGEKFRAAEIKVDKVQGEITSLAQETDGEFSLIYAQIQQTADQILQTVSSSYLSKDDQNQIIQQAVSTAVKQTSDEIIFQFDKTIAEVNEVSGNLDAYKEEIREYIRFIGAMIELGKSNSRFKAQLSNESLSFLDGSTVVAQISNKAMMIIDAEIKNRLAVGNFVFLLRENGSLSLVWKG